MVKLIPIVSERTAFVRPLVGALCVLVVTACGGGKEKPLAGERISVLSFNSQLQIDPRVEKRPVTLMPPFRNLQWSNPGGYPSHVAYHLEIDGLGEAFRIMMVSGNTADMRIKAPPVVAGGRVFALGANLDVAAVNAETGALLWQQSAMATYREPNFGLTRFLGIKDKPADIEDGFGGGLAYENGRVFVTTGFGEIMALSAETGEIIWRVQNNVPFSNGPTVRNGRVFVVSQDSRLQAISATDGVRLWEHLAITEQAGLLIASSPAVSDQIVVAGFNSGEVLALGTINGALSWSDSLTSRATQITPLSELNAIVGRPVIDRDRAIVTSHGGRTAAIDLRTGERIWTTDVGSIETPWVLGEFVLLVSLDGQVICLSRDNGRVRWISQLQAFEDEKNRKKRINWAGPVLASGKVLLVSSHGMLVTLDPADGTIEETIELGEAINLPPVIANGTLYLLSDKGALLALR